MRYLLVVGSRTFHNYTLLQKKLEEELNRTSESIEIVSGGAKGADNLAKEFARLHKLTYREFPANWNLYGKSAGYKRNEEMHKYISEKRNRKIIAFWDGKSKGTKSNFELAKKYGNEIEVVICDC